MKAFREIYEQFVDNASFLWVLRSIGVDQPHYYPQDIFDLEQRIESQLDGLTSSIEQAWAVCSEVLELEEPGEVFTSSVVALRSHDVKKIQQAVEAGLRTDGSVEGLISALAWLPGKLVHSWIKKFFTSKDLDHKYLAVAACSLRRENPLENLNRILERQDCRENVRLYCRCLRLIGEIRRQDLMPQVELALNSDDDDIRFWAIWSAVLLGNHDNVNDLKPFVLELGPNQFLALNLAFRVLPVEQARRWIAKLAETEDQARNVIKASGILGDPHTINWLIGRMQDRSVAKIAGEAFSSITGIELESNQLVIETGDQDLIQADVEADEADISLDDDEHLPWPDSEKIKQLWINHGSNFIAGQRYFLGRSISVEYIKSRLPDINQRHRQAAALELALIDTSMPLLNHRARVLR